MKMRCKTICLFWAVIPFAFAGCDDGKIYPEETEGNSTGLTVVMKGDISGAGNFYGDGFALTLSAFEDGNDYAVISKTVSDGNSDVTLSNIPARANTVELCVINSLRKRVMRLASLSVEDTPDREMVFNVGEVDASPFNVIGECVFATTCVQCHGATGKAAAGLDLLPEKAYSMLVDVPSTVVEGEMRVRPGEPDVSTLWQAVATPLSESWKYDHKNLLTIDCQKFIEEWIVATGMVTGRHDNRRN